jgi:hypothetical protein
VLVGAEPKNRAPFGPEYERWRGTRPDVPFTIGNYWPYATTLFDYVGARCRPVLQAVLPRRDVLAVGVDAGKERHRRRNGAE